MRAEAAGRTITLRADNDWVNQGTFSAVSGAIGSFKDLVNQGTVEATGGSNLSITSSDGNWSNAGTLSIAGGGVMNLHTNIELRLIG